MTPCLPISAVDSSIIVQLLSAARSVEVWTSLLPRLSSLPAIEIGALLSSLDLAVEKRSYYTTPLKLKRPRLGQSSLKDTSFLAPPFVEHSVDIYLFSLRLFSLCLNLYVNELLLSKRLLKLFGWILFLLVSN